MKQIRLLFITAFMACCTAVFGQDTTLADMLTETYEGKADTLTECLIKRFMYTRRGYFYAVPVDRPDRANQTEFIYWQQAHAMDVLVYSYERIKDSNPTLAQTYEGYFNQWFANHAHNWYIDENDETGFHNEFTDDMCWIALTMTHITEATGNDKFIEMAKTLFDTYIEPLGYSDDEGYWGLPWKLNNAERNACTNAPGCLLAAKLYKYTGEQHYLNVAEKIFSFWQHVMQTKLSNDGRVEEPPLTYTQGTFGEACRQLYGITGKSIYMTMAQKVINYACTSNRCVDNGILRHEGTSMDQSIFKAVLIPYAVNLVLDEACRERYRQSLLQFLAYNADTLWENLNLAAYPKIYCNYYWAEPFDESTVASMGAMVSGASLMENVARMALALKNSTAINGITTSTPDNSKVYDLNGHIVASDATRLHMLRPGIYIVSGRKTVVK